MKLAEALQERADLRRKVDMLSERLVQNSFVQEGDDPAEDPVELLRELDSATVRLEELIAAINKTNSKTVVGGRTITEMIARKDCLGLKVSVLRRVLSKPNSPQMRITRSELRYIRTLDVPRLHSEADELAKELRLVDNMLQKTNWETDLM